MRSLRELEITRIIAGNEQQLIDRVIVETPITLMVPQLGNFTILATPSNIKELAIGFLLTEGLITTADDIVAISDFNEEALSIRVDIKAPDASMEQSVVPITMKLPQEQIFKLLAAMQALQQLQQQTGSVHAAALYSEQGEMLAVCEDIGRHNALNKVIGAVLLKNKLVLAKILVLSSRISFEMVAKAAKAGVEIIIAISAPSSLAIEMAQKWNITLCGFVRGNRANIYSVPERVFCK